jgi:hypothetical protein
MLKNGRTMLHKVGLHCGCSCCNSKQVRRAQKKSLRQREARAWKRDQERAA